MIILALFDYSKIFSKVIFVIGTPIKNIEHVIELIFDSFFDKKEKTESNGYYKKILLGIIFSLPILVIVLALLSSADQVFADKISGFTNIFKNILHPAPMRELICRIGIIAIITVYITSFLHNITQNNFDENSKESKKICFDNTILNTILTILNLVYTLFCYIQIVDLFMGYTSLSQAEYANYARQGFFQLMFVSFINLTIILVSTHNQKTATNFQVNYTKIMNLLLAIFTLIILVSSFMRMYLYEQAFGYTFLRLMVYIILITEAILIFPTIMHIINKKVNLIKPYFIIITTMYVLVNFMNIDKIIAEKNIDRYINQTNISEKEIDFNYLRTTGIDGASQVARLLNDSNKNLSLVVNHYLYDLKLEISKMSFQELNLHKLQLQKELQNLEYKEYEYENNGEK